MMIISKQVQTINPSNVACAIILKDALTSNEVPQLRVKVLELLDSSNQVIYIDASDVINCDLSGVNEIIHSNYITALADKKIILVYKKKSSIANWINITGLNRFIATAAVPV